MADIKNASIEDLEKALAAKKDEERAALRQRKAELEAELREISNKLGESFGRRGGRGGSRFSNSMSLRAAIEGVLKGDKKGKTKDEIASAVQKAGYRSTSDNFDNIVYQTLYKHSDTFSRNGSGRYTMK